MVETEDNEAHTIPPLGHRPRTSQPNYFKDLTGKNKLGAGDSSHPLGSGLGAGEVNTLLNKKYTIDPEF